MIKAFFLHIPKTGGTSFMRQTRDLLGADNCYTYDQYGEIPEGFEDRIMLASHAEWRNVEKYAVDRFQFTILRDPVERVISWVNFEQDHRRVLPMLRDVEMYAHNRMTRQLGGFLRRPVTRDDFVRAQGVLSRMDVVAFTDTWYEDQALIYDRLGLDLEPSKLNTSSGDCFFSDEAIDYIKSITFWDQKLYEWAKNNYG